MAYTKKMPLWKTSEAVVQNDDKTYFHTFRRFAKFFEKTKKKSVTITKCNKKNTFFFAAISLFFSPYLQLIFNNANTVKSEMWVHIGFSSSQGEVCLQYLQGKPCTILRLQGNPIDITGFSLQILQKTPLIIL